MHPLEWYVDHADQLAQEVVDRWTAKEQSDRTGTVPNGLQSLFEMATQYRIAKATTEDALQDADLTKTHKLEENAARVAFAESYKAYSERIERGASA